MHQPKNKLHELTAGWQGRTFTVKLLHKASGRFDRRHHKSFDDKKDSMRKVCLGEEEQRRSASVFGKRGYETLNWFGLREKGTDHCLASEVWQEGKSRLDHF